MGFRRQLYNIIEPAGRHKGDERLSGYFDNFMMLMIGFGIAPLLFRQSYHVLDVLDYVSCGVFIIDYVLRMFTADLHLPQIRRRWLRFVVYPFTPMAIFDLLSILPSLHLISSAFKMLRLMRLLKLLRLVRFIRYYKPLRIMGNVMKQEGGTLLTVLTFAVFYIFVTALLMFNVEEPDSNHMFDTFFDAVYWATCTLTTVGYGDIFPTTALGRVVSMVSAIMGVAIIALPSGIITAGYLDELRRDREEQKQRRELQQQNREQQKSTTQARQSTVPPVSSKGEENVH